MGTGEQTDEDDEFHDSHPIKRRDIGAQHTGLDLWSFATALYGYRGVADACLRAQDEVDSDVNLILFALWAATRDQCLTPAAVNALEALVAEWRDQVIKPLRRQRRAFKQSSGHRRVYEAIKALELDAERSQLTWMEKWLNAEPTADKLMRESPGEEEAASRAGEEAIGSGMVLAQRNLKIALLDRDYFTSNREIAAPDTVLAQEVMATLLNALSADSATA